MDSRLNKSQHHALIMTEADYVLGYTGRSKAMKSIVSNLTFLVLARLPMDFCVRF